MLDQKGPDGKTKHTSQKGLLKSLTKSSSASSQAISTSTSEQRRTETKRDGPLKSGTGNVSSKLAEDDSERGLTFSLPGFIVKTYFRGRVPNPLMCSRHLHS